MKRTVIFVAMAAIYFCWMRYSAADVTVSGPVNSTEDSDCPVSDGFNYLEPSPPTKLPPPGENSAIFDELKGGDVDFSKWTFKQGGKLNGTLTIQDYHSKFKEGNHHSGGEIKLQYKKGAGDPANLQFVQMVNSNMPSSGVKAAKAKYPVIDPVPEDEPSKANPDPNKYRPFYWNENERPVHTGKAGSNFDIDFYDFSSRKHPPTSRAKWTGELYITSWDGNTPGTVTFHDGISWGWKGMCSDWDGFLEGTASVFVTVVTPIGGGPEVNEVNMHFNGAKGTIDTVLPDRAGDINVGDGNMINIKWPRTFGPNTPITVQFSADYQNVTFTGGSWYRDGSPVCGVDPCSTTVTQMGPGRDAYNLQMTNSTIPSGASWSDKGTGYDSGHWYRYSNSNWWNVWFYDGPYDANNSKKINASMTVRRLDPNSFASANITLGYSTGGWSYFGYNRPPLPGDVPTPSLENAYIYRDVNHPLFQGPVTAPVQIKSSIFAGSYHPEWLCVCVMGSNIEIGYGFANYDDPCTSALEGTDFDGNGYVNESDLSLVTFEWLNGSEEESKYESDLNHDGIVNFIDYAIWAGHWHESE